MPGAIVGGGATGGTIPAAGVQNNANPSAVVAPSVNVVLNLLSQRATNAALQAVAEAADEAAQTATAAAETAAAAQTSEQVDQKIAAAISELPAGGGSGGVGAVDFSGNTLGSVQAGAL